MNITEFLEARIGEDELRASYYGPLAMGTARVLAECAAKRAIIEAHRGQCENDDPGAWIVASNILLKSLAAVYKDHPDYQQEWVK